MKLIINGCGGRMGRTLLRMVHDHPACTLAGGLEAAGSSLLGQDLGTLFGHAEIGLAVSDNAPALLKDADGILDFTAPDASASLAGLAAQGRLVHIIGTTGFDKKQEDAIKAAARHAQIVKSGNMSLGVNLLAALVQRAAASLPDDWDIEIFDLHHRDKVDAPSGTALLLGEAAAQGRGTKLNPPQHDRNGTREKGAIGFASQRAGAAIGEHAVTFAGAAERLVLNHIAEDRNIFAHGAINAALWAQTQKAGLYSMADVLGLT